LSHFLASIILFFIRLYHDVNSNGILDVGTDVFINQGNVFSADNGSVTISTTGRTITKNSSECIIPPNSFVLARTVEYFKIPQDVLVICLGKSTYARCGIIVNVTPLEPGWEGHVTLEFSNTTPLPAKIYANEGVAQFIFIKGNEKPKVTYADRNGKYQGQKGVTLPKV